MIDVFKIGLVINPEKANDSKHQTELEINRREKIVEECHGLPLAAKVLSGLLRSMC